MKMESRVEIDKEHFRAVFKEIFERFKDKDEAVVYQALRENDFDATKATVALRSRSAGAADSTQGKTCGSARRKNKFSTDTENEEGIKAGEDVPIIGDNDEGGDDEDELSGFVPTSNGKDRATRIVKELGKLTVAAGIDFDASLSNSYTGRSLRSKRKAEGYAEPKIPEKKRGSNSVGLTTPRPRPRTGALVYESHPDELAENDQLQIINEDFERNPDDDDDDDDDVMPVDVEDKNSIPCRTLDDYTLFDELNGQQIVSWEVIGEKGRNVIAVGKVKAIMADGEREGEILQEEDESDSEDELAMDTENGKGKGKAVAKSQREKRSQMDQIVRLSAVFYWQDEVTKDGTVIWLRTQFAWYKLLSPSLKMAPLVMPVIRQLNLSTLVINTLVLNPSLEWEQFIKSLESSASGSTGALAAFCYTEKEVKTHAKQINEEINSWIESYLELGRDFPDGIFDSPIVRKIQLLSDGVRIAIGNAEGRRTIRRNVNDEVLKHKNDTTVTPWINKIAAGLFVRTLIVAEGGKKSKGIGDAQETEKDAALLVDLTCDPKTARNEAWNGRKVTKKVKWLGGSIWEDGLSGRTGYAGVEIDGETLVAGDCVAVRPGLDKHERKDKNKRKQIADSESKNDQDCIEEIWFAKIVFLFEDEDGGKCAHMRWFTHGADTILQETAGPRELFLLNQCDDNLLESVSCNIQVKKLDPEEREPEGEKKKNVFFYRYWYNTEQAYFEDPSKHENNFTSHNSCAKHQECDSCEAIARAKDLEKVSWLQDCTDEGFSIGGVEYRPGDFVYTIPPRPHDPYFIGQIMKVVRLEASERPEKSRKGKPEGAKQNSPDEAVGVKVRMLKRYDELNTKDFKEQLRDGKMIAKDNRHLYFTRTKAFIPAKELAGKCWVLHREAISDLDAFKDQKDTFWFDSYMESKKDETVDHLRKLSKDEVAMPDETINKREEEESVWKDYKDFSSKLRGMDIFAGAGGLTIGMDKTGAVQTKWAIEFAASAALAFKHNMPNVMVYNQCANLLLDRAIREHEGETIKDLKDFQGKLTPDMPKKGEVDFIYGGPPCQGFSGINRFQKVNDIKNSLIATFLSYVDFYQPQYFLLENVKGLLSHKLGQIKMGTVKFILRALTSMGYQARFGLLQAGQQGVPQTRRRVIFWGAKLGVDLPLFPQPSHCFSKNGQCTINLPDDMGSFATSKRGNHAPHASVLVGDVIVDLPGFEYENPHIVYPATAEQKQLESKRPWKKYDINACNKLGFAGKEKQSYKYPPLTEFQRSVRRGVQNDELTCHFTRTFNLTNVERICRIDLKPGSDHHTLPDKLKPWCLSHPDSKAAAHNGWRGLYGRLDPDGIFGTALTEIQPCGKSGTVIHPTQNRVISVREHARSQGFPDWYLFLSDTNKTAELHRQIGNAVPIPLAEALGKGLRDVVVEKWRKQRVHLPEGDDDDEL